MKKKTPVLTSPIVTDSRLGRIYQADPKSKDFPISAALPRKAYEVPRSRVWKLDTVLDQMNESSCVGHGFAHELLATPYAIKNITHTDAVKIYKEAQNVDQWPGSSYDGTSVLGGVKATQKLYNGTIESYRWAHTVQDVIATLGYHGPVVIGINWYQGFYMPDLNGIIKLTGNIVGGHCLLIKGVDIKRMLFLVHNSWGIGWGIKGCCYISFQDFERLLNENGEACIILRRGYFKPVAKR